MLHRDFCVVAICEDGDVRVVGRVPSTPDGLALLAQSLVGSDRVALEVTGSCWEVARILEPHVQRVVVVSPDDTGITQARAKTDRLDARVPVWTTERTNPSLLTVVGRHDGPVRGVAVSGAGRVVSGGEDGTVRLWDPSTPGDPGLELGRHDGPVRAVAVSREGRVMSGGTDGTVRLWDVSRSSDSGRVLGRHDGPVRALAVNREGRVISGGEDGTVRLWDPSAPDDRGRELSRQDRPVLTVAISRAGRIVSGGTDGTVIVQRRSSIGSREEVTVGLIGTGELSARFNCSPTQRLMPSPHSALSFDPGSCATASIA